MKYPLPPVPATPGDALGPEVVLVVEQMSMRDVSMLQSPEERALLGLIDGKRTVAEILRASRLSGFVAMRQLRSLSDRRLIRTVRHRTTATQVAAHRPPTPARPPAPSRPPSTPIRPGRIANNRMGLTQELTAVAREFAEPSYAPTPPPKVVTQPRQVTSTALVPVSTANTALAARPNLRSSPVPVPLGPVASQAVDLWFSLSRRDWRTLAIVPGHRAGSSMLLACALVEVGAAIHGANVELISAEGRDLVPTTDWTYQRDPDQRQRVLALDPISLNPMVIPVAQAADLVVIVVDRGVADMAQVRRTVESIGRHRIAGCVIVSPTA
jgi:hypothetical protein